MTSRTSLSRRDVLTAFLGSSLATSCRRANSDEPVPGELVDASALAFGHLLRGGPLPRATLLQPLDVLVVGGGIAGLSAGWRLAGAGLKDFLVCELEGHLGGTSQSGNNAITAYPWGAHYLPAPLENTGPVARLLREVGVLTGVNERGRPQYAEQVLLREPEERLFYRGFWYEGQYLKVGATAEDLAEWQRFLTQMESFALRKDGQGRRAFSVPGSSSSDDAEWTALDRVSMAQWLEEQGFRSARLRWCVDYACRDDFGTTADGVSAWAGIWYFAARSDGVGGRSAGHLTFPEGNGHWVKALADSVGASKKRTSVLIHSVEPTADRVRVFGVDSKTGSPVGFEAKQVVLATPRHVAARLFVPWREERPSFLDAFQSGPWVVANLSLKKPPTGFGFPLAWDNVFYESPSLGYVVATHQRARAEDEGPTVLTWYYPLSGQDVRAERSKLLATSYADWEAIVMADLSTAHPRIRQDALELKVMRWGHAMVRPRPGFFWSLERRRAQASIGSVHFAHSDLGGMGLFEEANAYGVKAAEAALRGLGNRVASWL